MAHANPTPCSYGIEPNVNLYSSPTERQAATRADYIARVVSEAPPLRDEQIDLLAVMLGPAIRQNAAPLITVAEYQGLEIQRHILHAETPGKFGIFGTSELAA